MTWGNIIERCHNPKYRRYPDYGGRGIVVCDRWRNSYEAFLEDMGRRPSAKHSIERIDNNGPYSPENCKWATLSEQLSNRRNSVRIEFNGRTMTVAEWSKALGIEDHVIRTRAKLGWTMDRIIAEPIRRRSAA